LSFVVSAEINWWAATALRHERADGSTETSVGQKGKSMRCGRFEVGCDRSVKIKSLGAMKIK